MSDPKLILTLRAKLDALEYYDENEIERVVKVVLDPKAKQKQLEAIMESMEVQEELSKRALGSPASQAGL